MTIKAVVFDLDGTLVDTAPDLMAATNHVLSQLKRRPITMPEVRLIPLASASLTPPLTWKRSDAWVSNGSIPSWSETARSTF
jgi:phosphoglycolate phosphatase-like HAD superfamily hydrolase